MAVLTRQTIQQLGIIDSPDPAQYRSIGYDLTVGSMYVPEDDAANAGPRIVEEYQIPPHGIVQIFSRETVDIPANICGYAMPKTGLCEKGILVLNTGILDPLYRGPLSGTAINFRKTPFPIKRGDVFLRLVFEETSKLDASRADAPRPITAESIRLYRSERMVLAQEYGSTFLNLRSMIQSISQTVTEGLLLKERNTLLSIIAVAALVFALLQFISPLIGKYFFSEETVAAKVLHDMKTQHSLDNAALKAQVDAQRLQIEDLRRRVEEKARTRPDTSPRK
jgi:deoxycytidine triphosphate deaminase